MRGKAVGNSGGTGSLSASDLVRGAETRAAKLPVPPKSKRIRLPAPPQCKRLTGRRGLGGTAKQRQAALAGLAVAVGFLVALGGCVSPGDRARQLKDSEALRLSNERLERTLAQRDSTIALLTRQVENLTALGPDRPVGAFSAMRIEIAKLSGGTDLDGKPGDDGVTVYLRPLDADGDAVKAPGRIRVELQDGSALGSPRVLGVYQFDDLEQLRTMWHGKFLTSHYSLRCPFPPGTALPQNRKVLVRAEFLDYLTGATLAETKEVSISPTP